jgi:hypothetical protein
VQTKRATDKLIEEFKTSDIRDVSVIIKPLRRHAELVYIPVFAIQFSYGETFNVHGERCKQFFNGLISASREFCVLITLYFESTVLDSESSARFGSDLF